MVDLPPGVTLFEPSRTPTPDAATLLSVPALPSHIEQRAADPSLVPPEATEVLRVYARAMPGGLASLVLAQPAGFAVPFEGASGEPRFGLWGTVFAQAVREVARGAALSMGKHEGDAFDEIVQALLQGLFDAPEGLQADAEPQRKARA